MASETTTTADNILIVDHDDEQRGLLVDGLGKDGFVVEVAKDGLTALQAARAKRPAAVIVGKLVSDMRGEYVVRELKTNRHTAPIPVIIMSGAPRGGPRVGAVWPGADAYISKFFHVGEVAAKLRGLLRLQEERATVPLIAGPLKLNRFHGEVHLDGKRLDLTLTEYNLLALLIEKRGRLVTREVLLRDIWGYSRRTNSRTADIHVHRVRVKLGKHAHMLETVHGGGYRLRVEPEI
jgi:DNA-binding response OmpR family regulator